MSAVTHVSVSAAEADQRLDRWFKTHYPDLAHGRLQKLLRAGQIRVDGKRAKGAQRLVAGQQIRVPPLPQTPPPPAATARPAPIDPAALAALRDAVLFMDEEVLVIDKPAGLAVQGGSGTHHHLDAMLDGLRFDAPERPRLVHRLDRDTSGVLLLARSARGAAALTRAFRDKSTRKLYWALVAGRPAMREGIIDAPLGKRPGRGGEKMQIDPQAGKSARTVYRVLQAAQKRAAWVALSPLSGRTHQLRVHCLSLGTPIVGDGKYGGRAAFIDGVAGQLHLHARAIDFPHPATGQRVVVDAPLPAHMIAALKALGLDPNRETRFITPEIHRRKP